MTMGPGVVEVDGRGVMRSSRRWRSYRAPLLAAALGLGSPDARAWLLHEHAATAGAALRSLNGADEQVLWEAWRAAARAAPRLCPTPALAAERLYFTKGDSVCVGLPALTGLGADHSCDPEDLRQSLGKQFVLHVLEEAEKTELLLRQAEGEARHIDVWHQHHLELQIVDPDYLGRAEVNGAHFQLPRRIREDLPDYAARVTRDGAGSNAIALYVNYHSAALQLAHVAAAGCTVGGPFLTCTAQAARDELFARAITAEAFALHFLQDAFSAGHVMSPNGTRAERMGTHDHYCKTGVAVRSWSGDEYVAHGDSFLDQEDTTSIAAALQRSLAELAQAFRTPVATLPIAARQQEELDACHQVSTLASVASAVTPSVLATLARTPMPVVDPPGLPQFQQELGLFIAPLIGVAGRVGINDKSWADAHRPPFLAFGGVGVGATFEGITDSTTDGVIALGANFLLDGRPPNSPTGVRLGGGFNAHLPYWIVPGDVILLAPVAAFSLNQYLYFLRRAAAGGFFGLQRKYSLPFDWKVQFVLGREAMVAFMPPQDFVDDPRTPQSETTADVISFSGTPGYIKLSLPVFSLTGFHASAEKVGLDALWQLGYDFTHYTSDETIIGGAAKGSNFHGIFLAFSYRARRYVYVP
jgi:hypothetical protein